MEPRRTLAAAALTAGLGFILHLLQGLGKLPPAIGDDFIFLVFYMPALGLLARWASTKLRPHPERSSS
jgi:hypothetical protein